MRVCKTVVVTASLFLGSFCTTPALAHQPGVSLGEIRFELDAIEWDVWIPYEDWTRAFFLQGNMPMIRNEMELHAARPEIERALIEMLSIENSGQACRGTAQNTRQAIRQDHPFAETRLRFTCDGPMGSLTFRAPLARAFLPQYRMFATLHGVSGTSTLLFGPGQEEITVKDIGSKIAVWPQVPKFIRIGIEHIFTGYDHILFLIGLILGAGKLRALIGMVTSFTVAHTSTLAAATLGYVSLSPRIVEPLIALSIVYIAVENLWRKPRKRWLVTFGFGLVHGLGFSSILLDMHLPRSLLGAGLLSFNLGVELGQIAIVALIYPLVRSVARFSWHRKLLRAASAAVLVAGSVWLLERTAFAHPEPTSYARIEIGEKEIRVETWIGAWEWKPFLPRGLDPTKRLLDERELKLVRGDVEHLFSETLFVKSGDRYCKPKVKTVKQIEMSGHSYLATTVSYICKGSVGIVSLDVRLPRKFGGGHQMIAAITSGDKKDRIVFSAESETWTAKVRPR